MTMQYAITTVDNPYNPFDNLDEWMVWDEAHGYNTLSYLARIVVTSEELPDALQSQAVSEGIDAILKEHDHRIYKKLWRDDGEELAVVSESDSVGS